MDESDRCECPFCEYRRSIDAAQLLRELAADEKYIRQLEARIGNMKDQATCMAAIGAAMIDILPLALDLRARRAVTNEAGAKDPFDLVDAHQFDVYIDLTISLMALIQASGFSDLIRGAGMRERIRVFGKLEPYGYGSNKLQ